MPLCRAPHTSASRAVTAFVPSSTPKNRTVSDAPLPSLPPHCVSDARRRRFFPHQGGGVYSDQSTLTVRDSLLADNLAGNDGGAASITSGTATFTNTTLTRNEAIDQGGALYGYADLIDVALLDNVAAPGRPRLRDRPDDAHALRRRRGRRVGAGRRALQRRRRHRRLRLAHRPLLRGRLGQRRGPLPHRRRDDPRRV